MTVGVLLIILVLSLIVFGAFFVIARKQKLKTAPFISLLGIPSVILVFVLILMGVSAKHGMKSLAESKGKTMFDCPVSMLSFQGFNEDTLPENTQGAIIIFVKYGCPDCTAIYSTINEFASHENVYIIHSTSEVGRELIARYNIADVPAAVYVRINNYNGGLEYTQKSLYTTDEAGNVIPNTENINRLLELQSQQK